MIVLIILCSIQMRKMFILCFFSLGELMYILYLMEADGTQLHRLTRKDER